MFGVAAAFSKDRLWSATEMSASRYDVRCFPAEKITGGCERACPGYWHLIRNMAGILAEKALMLNKRLEYLIAIRLRVALCRFFYDRYRKENNIMFTLPLNRKELARYLAVTRPSLPRELARMKEEGPID